MSSSRTRVRSGLALGAALAAGLSLLPAPATAGAVTETGGAETAATQTGGADRARLAAAAAARQETFSIGADAISLSTKAGGATYAYDNASNTLGKVLAAASGGSMQWSPGGDVLISGSAGHWTTYDREFNVLTTMTRPAGTLTPGWFPTGDGFIEQVATRNPATIARSLSPGRTWQQPLPAGSSTYGRFAVSPYGTEAVTRGTTATGSNLYLVPMRSPMSLGGQSTTAPVRDYFVSAYRPGDPAIAQEPGKGVRDPSARTFVAFLGVEPGSKTGKLFVDYQDGRVLGAPLEPTAVVETGAACTTSAPAFSPDRRRIAYLVGVATTGDPCTQTAVRVVSLGADGRYDPATAKNLTTSTAGNPFVDLSWRPTTAPVSSLRIGGADRYEVGVNVSRSVYADGAAKGAVIAGGEAYADALTGSPLAAALKGPLMLTKQNAVSSAVVAELTRALQPNAPIYVLGGEASVSENVVATLRATGHPVTRVGGVDRFSVAVAVANTLTTVRGGAPQAVFVANGRVFPDALVAGPAAAATRGVILLSDVATLPAATKAYLQGTGAKARLYGIGGGGSLSVAGYPNLEVVTGADRYEVARRVADRFFTAEWIATIVSGENWPDATTGGALISQWQQPILLSKGTELSSWTAGRLDQSRSAIDLVVAFGGPSSVTPEAFAQAVEKGGTQTAYYGSDAPR